MAVTLALAGDTMLGRAVACRLTRAGPRSVVADEVRDVLYEADLVVLNLECCISARGSPQHTTGKRFFFRAPPVAVDMLNWLGVDAVTLANNHALDYGPDALLDTRSLLEHAGIAAVGAGASLAEARMPAILRARGLRVGVLGVTDHPVEFAADSTTPGVAYADLAREVPRWLLDAVRCLHAQADVTAAAQRSRAAVPGHPGQARPGRGVGRATGPGLLPHPVGPRPGLRVDPSRAHRRVHGVGHPPQVENGRLVVRWR